MSIRPDPKLVHCVCEEGLLKRSSKVTEWDLGALLKRSESLECPNERLKQRKLAEGGQDGCKIFPRRISEQYATSSSVTLHSFLWSYSAINHLFSALK